MNHGRRFALLIAAVIGLSGTIMCGFLNFYMILTGRVLFGFAAGIISAAAPRYIEETVPSHLYDYFGPTFPFAQTIGALCGFFITAILPADDDKEALAATNKWRVVYCFFPASLFLVMLMSLLLVV